MPAKLTTVVLVGVSPIRRGQAGEKKLKDRGARALSALRQAADLDIEASDMVSWKIETCCDETAKFPQCVTRKSGPGGNLQSCDPTGGRNRRA